MGNLLLRRRIMLAQGGGGGGEDMSKSYFYIEALEDGMTAKLSSKGLSYSIDECQTWKSLGTSASPSLNAGDKIYFKGSMNPTEDDGIGTFTVTAQCNVGGNIMSLLFADDFVGQDDLTGYDHVFYYLFKEETYLISAENLILPATTLAEYCYDNIFCGCTSLTTPPELPATTLAGYCYRSMFYGCTSLTTPPELPATTLAEYCYVHMFNGCTSLTIVPELPATTLAEYCYAHMFRDCTSLTTAPELPATTLAEYCYRSMFYGCSKLNYIKMLATDISASYCMRYWVLGVASSGTFVKNKDATWTTTGTSGVPSGWTIEYA